ncbi:hypothetical protein C0J52_22994 [Blattella germanica]|nr:hypothetical protein C0J52_22994 [Blattella germanica]
MEGGGWYKCVVLAISCDDLGNGGSSHENLREHYIIGQSENNSNLTLSKLRPESTAKSLHFIRQEAVANNFCTFKDELQMAMHPRRPNLVTGKGKMMLMHMQYYASRMTYALMSINFKEFSQVQAQFKGLILSNSTCKNASQVPMLTNTDIKSKKLGAVKTIPGNRQCITLLQSKVGFFTQLRCGIQLGASKLLQPVVASPGVPRITKGRSKVFNVTHGLAREVPEARFTTQSPLKKCGKTQVQACTFEKGWRIEMDTEKNPIQELLFKTLANGGQGTSRNLQDFPYKCILNLKLLHSFLSPPCCYKNCIPKDDMPVILVVEPVAMQW